MTRLGRSTLLLNSKVPEQIVAKWIKFNQVFIARQQRSMRNIDIANLSVCLSIRP